MRFRLFILPVAAIALLSIGLHAQATQAKPDFSGTWTLVADKSDFGEMPAPASMTRTITHKDPDLKIVTAQTGGMNGDTTITTNLSTDGKPHTNDVGGSMMTTTGKWDGAAIVLHSTANMQGADVTLDDRYELSDGGKTLTVTRKIATPDTSFTMKIVLAKK
jgi:hypothetical protein